MQFQSPVSRQITLFGGKGAWKATMSKEAYFSRSEEEEQEAHHNDVGFAGCQTTVLYSHELFG